MLKAKSDPKQYRYITLDNGLSAVLVSDPRERATTKEAGVALSVGVGSFSDPPEMQGLAHFLEHMILMGNKKYAGENELDEYLNSCGGFSNAYTECEFTMYYMTVLPEFLGGAMDRFANVFIEPLLRPDAFHREINAVDSEFKGALQSDAERTQQIFAARCSEGHPYGKFLWGNKQSLNGKGMSTKRAEALLRNFYENNYSADIMKLTVVSAESLDCLEDLVRSCFSGIKNIHLQKARGDQALSIAPQGSGPSADSEERRVNLDRAKLNLPLANRGAATVVHTKALRQESNYLKLTFQLPAFDHLYEMVPTDYIASLLGHESEGSILEELKKRGWATDISCGCNSDGFSRSSYASLFDIAVVMTKLGRRHYLEIIEIVFAYVEMLRAAGPQRWYHEELKIMAALDFDYAAEGEVDDLAIGICETLSRGLESIDHVLTAGQIFFQWSSSLVDCLLGFLTPENIYISLLTSDFDESQAADSAPSLEPWFNAEYRILPIEPNTLASWKQIEYSRFKFLYMPRRNDFIPQDLTMKKGAGVEAPQGSPKKILDNAACRLWYFPDYNFKRPKVNAVFYLWLPNALKVYGKAASTVYLELYVELTKMLLTPFAYFADIAGLDFAVEARGGGIQVIFRGFNDKAVVLAEQVIGTLRDVAIGGNTNEEYFAIIKESLRRKYLNATIKPQKQASAARLSMLLAYRVHPREAAEALEQTTIELFESYASLMYRVAFYEGLVSGNMTEAEALDLFTVLTKTLTFPTTTPMSNALEPEFRIVDLERKAPSVGETVSFLYEEESDNTREKNTAIEVYFQMDFCNNSWEESITCSRLLSSLISEKFFDILRTKEQLGYNVDCDNLWSADVVGFNFRIKSPTKPGKHLEDRIESFINRIGQYLKIVPEDHYKKTRESLAKLRLLPDDSLWEQTMRIWRQILDRKYAWNATELEAAAIRKTELPTVFKWYKNHFLKHRKKLCVIVNPGTPGTDLEEVRSGEESESSEVSEGSQEGDDESSDVAVPETGLYEDAFWWKKCSTLVNVENIQTLHLQQGVHRACQ